MSEEIEKVVLGAIMLDADSIYQCGTLKPEDFKHTWHQRIYKTVHELAMSGSPVDMVTVVSDLESKKLLRIVGGAEYLASLIDGVPDRPRIEHYVAMLLDASRRRSLEKLCTAAIAQCADTSESTADCLSVTMDRILDLSGNMDAGRSVKLKDYSFSVYQRIEILSKTPLSDLPVGLSTGIRGIDRSTTGLREGEFWVIASWTGEGKTVLSTQIIVENAKSDVPVLWFTQEMKRDQVLLRMIPQLTNGIVKGRHLRDPRHMTPVQLSEFKRTQSIIDAWPLWVYDASTIESSQLYAHARSMVKLNKISLIVVDYIQLVKGRGEKTYDRVSDVSNTLRRLAKDTGVPVVAISQLSKPEKGVKPAPRAFDMKESGSIEQDAHVILLPYRPQEKDLTYTGDDKIIIGKQRDGATGTVDVRFDSLTLTFQGRGDDVYSDKELF